MAAVGGRWGAGALALLLVPITYVTYVASAPQAAAATGCPGAPYGVNRYAPGSGRTVALTFDDGPGRDTSRITAVLAANHITATFFDLGTREAANPAAVRAQHAAGYALGGHTWNHAWLPGLDAATQASMIDRERSRQAAITGHYPCLFRAPGGGYDATTLRLAQQRGMRVFNWSVDTEDWKAGGSGSADWVSRIVTRAEAGAGQTHPVILMHDLPVGSPATVAALPTIIRYYKAHGYAFVDLFGRTGAPIGSFESAVATFGGMRVSGWAIDPSTSASGRVHVYVDSHGWRLSANRYRPDVARRYPAYGPRHGFAATLSAPPGRHRVCVYAPNVSGPGGTTRLGCRTVRVSGSPGGRLDSVTASRTTVQVSGWAIDPDTVAAIHVHVYVDASGHATLADLSRPDVAARYPHYGTRHGYSVAVDTTPGTHRVCAYAINAAGSGGTASLGCRTVTVSGTPFGHLDAVTSAPSAVQVSGWAIDPDTLDPIEVSVYVDASGGTVLADVPRPDVAADHPRFGDQHGFSVSVATEPGSHRVCVYAPNAVGSGTTVTLGCETVEVTA